MSHGQTAGEAEALGAVLNDTQLRWLRRMGAEQTPAQGAATMLGRLVDQAMAEHGERARRREQRLEIYRASGYSEHHPDYPNVPRGLTDV